MKTYEKVLLIIGTILVILFILFGIPQLADMLKASTGMDFRIFMYLGVVFLLYVIGQMQGGGKYKKLNEELRTLDRELAKTHRIEYYITQNKRLYKTTQDNKYRQIILSNIATAYYHDGAYDKSENVMQLMEIPALSEGQQASMYNLQLGNAIGRKSAEDAKAIYEAHRELFEKYEQDKEYRNHYLVTRLMYQLLEAGKDQEAIAKIRSEFDKIAIPAKVYEKAYSYRLLEGKLKIAEGEGKEGKDLLRKLNKEYIMPGMRKEIARSLKI